MYLAENNALYESNWFSSSQERKDLFQIHGEYAVSVQSRTSRAKCSLQKFFFFLRLYSPDFCMAVGAKAL